MNIKEMHGEFSTRLNKNHATQSKSFTVIEIDSLLNNAQLLFVNLITNNKGFEYDQKVIDMIRTLIIDSKSINVVNDHITLPSNYWRFIKGKATVSKNDGKEVTSSIIIHQHDDLFINNVFYKSSFEWRIVTASFATDKLRLYPSDFTIHNVLLTYIKKLNHIHNASSVSDDGYDHYGVQLRGTKDCELPENTHSIIVDIAVLIAVGETQNIQYDNKLQAVSLSTQNNI